MIKNPPANAGDLKRQGLDPCVGMIPVSAAHFSILENCMDRGDWCAIVLNDLKESDTGAA